MYVCLCFDFSRNLSFCSSVCLLAYLSLCRFVFLSLFYGQFVHVYLTSHNFMAFSLLFLLMGIKKRVKIEDTMRILRTKPSFQMKARFLLELESKEGLDPEC